MKETALITVDSDAYRLGTIITDVLDNVVSAQARRDALIGKGYCGVFENLREGYPIIGETCARLEGVLELITLGCSGTPISADFSTFVDIANLTNIIDTISTALAVFERT